MFANCKVMFCLVFLLIGYGVAIDHKDSLVTEKTPVEAVKIADRRMGDFMVMDEADSPVVQRCGPNVNCAFIVYDHRNIVSSVTVPCKDCIDGYDCTFAGEDRSQCMYVYECLPSEGSEGRRRREKVYKLPSPEMLAESKSEQRTGRELSHCRPPTAQWDPAYD